MPPMPGSRRFQKAARDAAFAALPAEEQAAVLAARAAKRAAALAAGRLVAAKAARAASAAAKAGKIAEAYNVVRRAVDDVVLPPDCCTSGDYVGRRELVEAVRAHLVRSEREGAEYGTAAEAKLGALLASPQTPLSLQRLVWRVLDEEGYVPLRSRQMDKDVKAAARRVDSACGSAEGGGKVAVWTGIRLRGRAPCPNAKSEAKKQWWSERK